MSELWEIVEYSQIKVGDVIKHTVSEPALLVQFIETTSERRGHMNVTSAFECEVMDGIWHLHKSPRISGETVFRRVPNA